MASPGALDQRRPSASLRTRRASTVYEEREDGPPAPAVPSIPSSHLTPYDDAAGGSLGSGPPTTRPSPRHAKSGDSDNRSGGRNRAGTSQSGHSGQANADNSKVGAYLLNKRQSVSFGKAMAGQQRSMVMDQMGGPPVPALPGQRQESRVAHTSMRRTVDPSAGEEMLARGPRGPAGEALTDLLKEQFDADAFLQGHLQSTASNNSAAQLDDMRRLKAALSHYLDQAQGTLQTNVIKNYHEFIKVSKDIASLETEMMELKGVLEEWKTVPESLEIEQTFDQNSGMNRNRRNSVADLQALYKTQLEALWDSVEGAQRFLPVVPNRHILGRFSNWIELNSATYRPRQSVILVLLNDALLVAVEKRRQMGGQVKVVADRCFHLNEIAVTDLKDTGGLTDAIRIKRDREVSIFRTEMPEEKRQLLSAFKKILEDTLSRRRKESVWEAEHRRDTVYSGSRNAPGDPRSKDNLASFQPSRLFPFVTSNDPSGKDLSWIDDVSDRLAVHIALREFDEAVSLIETAKSVLPQIESDLLASQLLRTKIDTRSDELSAVLLGALADTSIRKTGVVKNSGWLLRLGQGERARETFMSGRGELLKKRTGDVTFSGQGNSNDSSNSYAAAGLVTEIAQLAFVCFTVIRNTCEWYMAAYKDHQAASAFVRWASTQVETFADIFKRQVYNGKVVDPRTVQQCVDTATSQAAMLKEVGLDFAFLLSNRLHPPTGA